MSNIPLNTNLLDKAIVFATKAHGGTERRGKGFPYIVHPLEAVSICATITSNQEVLAAAALHDVVEDTEVTLDEIEKEFGPKVASLVCSESEVPVYGKSEEDSWIERKQAAIDRLANASYEGKIVALGDKLSNMRAIYRDFLVIGDEIWNRFHVNDIKLHEWHYRGLVGALIDLKNTTAFKEFESLVDRTFEKAGKFNFKMHKKGNLFEFCGVFDKEAALKLEAALEENTKEIKLDFADVLSVTFAGLRTLQRMHNEGYRFVVINANPEVVDKFYSTGVNASIPITKKFVDYDVKNDIEFGGGYCSTTFNSADNDSIVKLYKPFISADDIEREKRLSNSLVTMGIPTPFVGDLIKVGDQLGITFERVFEKKSIARALADNPDRLEELVDIFTKVIKQLHSTQCFCDNVPSLNSRIEKEVNKCEILSKEEKQKILNYVAWFGDVRTCVHGDCHIGNVIITKKGDALIIDNADFCYGNSLYDIATMYVVCHTLPDEKAIELYHVTNKQLHDFWNLFIKKYLETDDVEVVNEFVEGKVIPWAGIRTLFYGNQTGFHHGMDKNLKEFLLKRI